jgi:serine/threonine protein kinase
LSRLIRENQETIVFGTSAVLLIAIVGVLICFILYKAKRKRRQRLSQEMDHSMGENARMMDFPLAVSNNRSLVNYDHSQTHNFTASSIGNTTLGHVNGHYHSNSTHPLLSQDCNSSAPSNVTAALIARPSGHSTLQNVGVDSCMSSGSGAGGAQMRHITLANDLKREGILGSGRYGEVWKGVRKGDDVAIKTFRSTEETSFQKEKAFYRLPSIAHKNILLFIGADCTSLDGVTVFIIVLEFHKLGSLYDYLKSPALATRGLTLDEALYFCNSAVCGVSHLHDAYHCDQPKPSIAHRDLKTKNLLVKKGIIIDGVPHALFPQVCIADFGLAVWEPCDKDPSERAKEMTYLENALRQPKVGTKRYMAPEILSFNPDPVNGDAQDVRLGDHSSLLRADIYALALVMWEVFRIVKFDDSEEVIPHDIPYSERAPNDPSYDLMREIVVVDKERPPFPPSWTNRREMEPIQQMIEECWTENPSARLRIQAIKSTFKTIMTRRGLITEQL